VEKRGVLIYLTLEEPIKESFLLYKLSVDNASALAFIALFSLIKKSEQNVFTFQVPFSIRVFGVKIRGSVPIRGSLRLEIEGQ
jgi:hypothetical protein